MNNLQFTGGSTIEMKCIEELEKELGITFPTEYKVIILKHNGGGVLPFDFRVGKLVECINNFFDIEKKYYFHNKELPKGVIPFARDAGGNKICFDYREEGKVEIVFWDHGSPKNNGLDIRFVARSFKDFLNMLFEFDE